jgi:AbiV family abortive infection protein
MSMSIEQQLERLDKVIKLIDKRARMAVNPIPKKAIPQGVMFCLANARRLFDDAKSLFTQQRYASSAQLGSLAFEELGKGVLVAAGWKKGVVSKERVRELFHRGSKGHLLKLRAPIERGRLIGVQSPEPARRIREVFESAYHKRNEIVYVDWFVRFWRSPTDTNPNELRFIAKGLIDSLDHLLPLAETNLPKTFQ